MSIFDRQPAQHGTRRRYQQGCRCVPCKVSNNRYQRTLYALRAKGKTPLGVYVSAGRTWQMIRQMLPEFGGEQALAARLGLKKGELQFNMTVIRLRTALRIARLYRRTMVVNPDAPHEEPATLSE